MKKHTRNQFTYNQQANNALRSFYSTQYRHEQLPTYRLISNNGYQRPVDAKHVAEIIDNFNPLYLDEIIVSHRDGQYFVVDGQNRVAALKKMNGDRDCMVNCRVYTNLSYEDEAAMFYHLDAIKNKLKYHEKVKAMAEAGDNASVQDIKQILAGIGLRWSLTGSRSGSRNNISASRTLIECYEAYGRVIFYHGMLLLKKTWDGDSKTLTAPFIKGICHFAFFYIQMVTEDNFVKKLSCVSPGEIRMHAQQETTVTRQETKYARALLKIYNQNRQMSNRLPDLLDETGIDVRKRNEMAVPFQTAMMPGPAKTASPRPRKNQQNRLDANGDYPLQADVNGKSTSFDTGWPSGVIRPATLPLQQMILSTVGQEAYPLSVQVALTKGWFMECALVVDAEDSTNIDYSSKDNIWIPADAFFIDPAGLVHDLPGDPADDDTVVVIS